MKPYIVTYIDDDGEFNEKLVYAVGKEAAMKLIDFSVSAKEYEVCR